MAPCCLTTNQTTQYPPGELRLSPWGIMASGSTRRSSRIHAGEMSLLHRYHCRAKIID
jgi:hypothetical protein